MDFGKVIRVYLSSKLSKDEIMFLDEDIMVTRWDPINPRMDFAKGYSCIYLMVKNPRMDFAKGYSL
jgi:hypothetical protein